MKKKKSRIIALVIGTAVTCAMAGVLAACGGEGEAFKPGDAVVDSVDVKYTIDKDGNVIEKEYTGKDISVKYLLDNSSYVLLEGKRADDLTLTKYVGDLTEVSLASIEEKVTVEDEAISVTAIGEKAFYGCDTLQSLDLSKATKSLSFEIGKQAFAYCVSLETVTLPESVYVDYNIIGEYAFSYCEKLSDITVGEKFATVEQGAFAYCTSLSSIALSPKQKVIEAGTFYHCDNLTNVTFSDEIRSINQSAFANTGISNLDLSRYTKLRSIGSSAFEKTKLSTVTLPDSVTYIGNRAFFNCYDLVSVEIPFIGNTLGETPNASSFTSIYGMVSRQTDSDRPNPPSLPENPDNNDEDEPTIRPERTMSVTVKAVTKIPARLFSGCDYLTSLNVQSYVTPGTYFVYDVNTADDPELDEERFDGITHREIEIEYDDIDKTVNDSAFANCVNLASVSLPSDTEEIGMNAFENCKALTGFAYPAELEAIGAYAFSGCTRLQDTEYPAELRTIGSYAFKNCKALTKVTIGEKITEVGEKAYSGCTGIQTVNVAKANGVFTEKEEGYIYSQHLFDHTISEWFDNNNPYATADSKSATENNVKTITIGSAYMIPAKMFYGFSHLTNVEVTIKDFTEEEKIFIKRELGSTATIPASEIGNEAFKYCRELTNNGLKIYDEKGLIKRIGDSAFLACASLTSYTVPASVTDMGSGVFADCISLRELTVEKYSSLNSRGTINTLNDWFSSDSVYNNMGNADSYMYNPSNNYSNAINAYIPNTLSKITIKDVCQIPNYAFLGWSSLNTLNVTFRGALSENYTTSIGNYAFSELNNHIDLTLSNANNVKSIGNYAFANNNAINAGHVNAFTMVKSIDSNAFANCTNISGTINLSASLNWIGNNVFLNCANIDTLNIGNYEGMLKNSNYGSTVSSRSLATIFGYSESSMTAYFTESDFVSVNNYYVPRTLKTVTVSGLSNIDSLNTNFFKDVSTIERISLATTSADTSFVMDGNNPFSGCTNLQKVFLPNTIEKIFLSSSSSMWGTTDLSSYFEVGCQNGTMPVVYTYRNSSYGISDYGNYWTGSSSYPEICEKPTTNNTVTITFNYGEAQDEQTGTTLSPVEVNAINGVINAAPTAPVNTGKTIVGYYDNSSFSGIPVSFPYFSESSKTLYAKWVADEDATVEYPDPASTTFTVTENTNGVTLHREGTSTATYAINVWSDRQISGTITLYSYSSYNHPSVRLSIGTLNGTTVSRTITAVNPSYSQTFKFSYKVKAGETFTVEYTGRHSYDWSDITLTVSEPTSITAPVIPEYETFMPSINEIVGDVKGSQMTEEQFNQAIESLYSSNLKSYTGTLIRLDGLNITVHAETKNNGDQYYYVTSDYPDFQIVAPLYITQEYGTRYLYFTINGILVRCSQYDLTEMGAEDIAQQLDIIIDNVRPNPSEKPDIANVDTTYDSETGTRYVVVNGSMNGQSTVLIVAATMVNGKLQLSLGLYVDEVLSLVIRYTDINNTTVTPPTNFVTPDSGSFN